MIFWSCPSGSRKGFRDILDQVSVVSDIYLTLYKGMQNQSPRAYNITRNGRKGRKMTTEERLTNLEATQDIVASILENVGTILNAHAQGFTDINEKLDSILTTLQTHSVDLGIIKAVVAPEEQNDG